MTYHTTMPVQTPRHMQGKSTYRVLVARIQIRPMLTATMSRMLSQIIGLTSTMPALVQPDVDQGQLAEGAAQPCGRALDGRREEGDGQVAHRDHGQGAHRDFDATLDALLDGLANNDGQEEDDDGAGRDGGDREAVGQESLGSYSPS